VGHPTDVDAVNLLHVDVSLWSSPKAAVALEARERCVLRRCPYACLPFSVAGWIWNLSWKGSAARSAVGGRWRARQAHIGGGVAVSFGASIKYPDRSGFRGTSKAGRGAVPLLSIMSEDLDGRHA
jgi:hypothetical protein